MVSEGPEALVCDLDGVVYRGSEPVPGVAAAIGRMQRRGVRVLFCSNNSNRSRAEYVNKLRVIGIEARPEDLLTSGTVLEEVLIEKEPSGQSVFCIGGQGVLEAVGNAGMRAVRSDDASLVCVGFDLAFDYEAMRTATSAVLAGAGFYATNDDPSFPASVGLWPGAGAILASIETASGRRAVVVGKPQQPMIDAALRRLDGKTDVVIVGDRIDTDIAMGKAAGWRTCLVLSGVTEGSAAGGEDLADEIYGTLAEAPWAQ